MGKLSEPELGPDPVRVMLVRFGDWPLAAIRLGLAPGDPAGDSPLIVVAKGVVLTCCPRAAAEGVHAGVRVREAQLRCPQAVIREHLDEVDETAFEVVLRAIAEIAPDVHPVRPGVAAVRARGPARFYGGEDVAARTLLERLIDFATPDCRPTVAVADGVFAAEQAAAKIRGWSVVPPGASRALLAELAVESLNQTLLARQLRQLGIGTLGRFAELSRAEVHNRFGAVGRRCHQLACGEDLQILRSHNPAGDRSVDIDTDAADSEQVVAHCAPVIERLIRGLDSDSLVLTEVRIRVTTEHRRDDRLWRHPWNFDSAELLNRLRWQLLDLAAAGNPLLTGDPEDQADPVRSDRVVGVQLIPTRIVEAQAAAQGLWGSRPESKVIKVLSGLQDRLGYRQVRVVVPQGGRLAKDRRTWVPFGTAPPTPQQRRAEQPWPGRVPGPPPALVLDRPTAARLLDATGEPVRVDERGNPSAEPEILLLDPRTPARQVIAWAGPWVVRERWWDAGAGTDRLDRFQVVDELQQAWLLALVGDGCWLEAGY